MARARGRHAVTLCDGGAAALGALEHGDSRHRARRSRHARAGRLRRAARRAASDAARARGRCLRNGLDASDALQALELGACDYLLKPVSPDEVRR